MLEWTRNTSRTYTILKWLIFSMSVIGWYVDGYTRKRTKFLQILNVFVSVLIYIGSLYILAEIFQNLGVSLGISALTNSIVFIIILIFSSVYIPSRFNKFVRLSDRMKEIYPFYATRAGVNLGIILSGLIYFAFAAINIAVILYQGIGNVSRSMFQTYSLPVCVVSYTIYFYQRFVIMSMIHCMCWVLKGELREIAKELNKMAETAPSATKIEELKNRYVDVTDLTEMADNILCPFVSVVLTISFFQICFVVNAVLMKDQEIGFVSYLLSLASDVYTLTFLLTQSCLLHESLTACIAIPSKFCSLKMNTKVTGQTFLLLEVMKNKEVGLSFMKMFIFNKTSVLTVIGTLVTYIIIVLQFKPE